MADSPLNLMDAPARTDAATPGDLPERLRRRYLAERQGRAVALFVDATAVRPAFRDEGRRLSTDRNDPNTIRDMVAVARHRGWTSVLVRGRTEFRREAWLAARAAGLEVQGYPPTERDEQTLARGVERHTARRPEARTAGHAPRRPATPAADRLRVVEAVVTRRVVEPSARDAILARARAHLARRLEPESAANVRRVRRERNR